MRTDIADLHLDAIVNATKESLLGGVVVNETIHAKTVRGLLEECRKLGGCKALEAKITLF